jgi:hypothetical protein
MSIKCNIIMIMSIDLLNSNWGKKNENACGQQLIISFFFSIFDVKQHENNVKVKMHPFRIFKAKKK